MGEISNGFEVKYLDKILSNIYEFAEKLNEISLKYPANAMEVGKSLQEVFAAIENYKTVLNETDASDFKTRRASSKKLSNAIIELRHQLLAGLELAQPEDQPMYSVLLDEALTNIWDPHIKRDMVTYTAEHGKMAAEALAAPFLALEDYAKSVKQAIQ